MPKPYAIPQPWPNITLTNAQGDAEVPAPPTLPPSDQHDQPAKPVLASAHVGFIDVISLNHVVGWVWCPDDPAQTIDVELLDDDQPLLTVSANLYRPDLKEAGIGTGHYGFSLDNISFLFPKSRHLLRLRNARTKVELPGSPRLLTRHDVGFDERAADFITGILTTIANTATTAAPLDEAIALLLARLNDLINARFRLDAPSRPDISDHVSRVRLTDWTNDLVATLLHTYQPIHIPPAAEPRVSIIIPVHNKFAITYDCIASIAAHLPNAGVEIIIVDDGSRDETLFAALILSGAIRTIRTKTNGGFIAASNFGAAAAKGDYLFFLNNDTLVREGWLDTLLDSFAQIPNIGIVGSRLFFPDGTLQEVGGIIWKMGDACTWGRNDDPASPAYNYLRDADYVSGAALMIPRPLFERLDGFDAHFSPAYYEDTDLCFRVRAQGLRVVVQPASEIVHLEGASNGTDPTGPGLKRYQIINHRKFFLRWQSTLAKHRMTAEQPLLEAERQVRRRAYFIDDSVLTPDQDAGSNAALQHIRALQQLGYKVTFIPADNMARIDPHTRALEKIGVECLYAPYFWSVEEVLRKATIAPDLIYLHRFSNASKYAAMVREKFPKARIIYNVADLHFLREEREAALSDEPTLHLSAAIKRKRELAATQQVDCVIVHSTTEAALLRKLLPDIHIETVGWAVPLRPTPIPFADRIGYGFVGGFRHKPNVDAVEHFISTIMPNLPASLDQRLTIIGSNMPPEIAQLHGPTIDICGYIPILSDALNPLRCTIAPLRYGAGVKGKVFDSFAHGLPCVMSEIAAEGLPIDGDLTWLIARTPQEFAQKLARLLVDEEWNTKMSKAGMAMMDQHFSAISTINEISRTL